MARQLPIIGISAASFPEPEGFEPMLAVERPYLESVLAAGGVPLMIPFLEGEALERLAAKCDGFLFPGGEDVSPALFGEQPHPKLGKVSLLQDNTEISLVRIALREKKPVLGICRGLQMMNVACGGSLFQDIPSQNPTDLNHSVAETPAQFASLAHTIEIEGKSQLGAIMEAQSVGVNSNHHQAIKKLGAGLVVSATSSDGIIEGIEMPSQKFFVAVQGHPEVIWQKSEPRWKRLFEAFINAIN